MSFQCSKHATAEGIIGVFRLCADYQLKRNKRNFVSVAVLDEVGLAEDSENMPLKVVTKWFYMALKMTDNLLWKEEIQSLIFAQ